MGFPWCLNMNFKIPNMWTWPHLRIHLTQERAFMMAGVVIFSLMGSFILWGPTQNKRKKLRSSTGVNGLVNMGETCFLNTLLQAIAACPLFCEWLKNHQQSAIAQTLWNVVQYVNGRSGAVSSDFPQFPRSVIKAMADHGWSMGRGQQDSHELFFALMSCLEEQTTQPPKPQDILNELGSENCLAEFSVQENHVEASDANMKVSQSRVVDVTENKFHPDTELLTNDNKSCKDLISSKDASSNEAVPEVLSRDSEITNHSKFDILPKLADLYVGLPGIGTYTLAEEEDEDDNYKSTDFQHIPKDSYYEDNPILQLPDLKIQQDSNEKLVGQALAINKQDIELHETIESPKEQLANGCKPGNRCSVLCRTGGYFNGFKTQQLRTDFPFRGQQLSHLSCTVCSTASAVQHQAFDCISLVLPDKGPRSLKGMLTNFTAPELVHEVHCDHCSALAGHPVKTIFMKQLSIGRLPKCLCVHIQRTTWLGNGLSTKRHDFVAFPEVLCMDQYTYYFKERMRRFLLKQAKLKNQMNCKHQDKEKSSSCNHSSSDCDCQISDSQMSSKEEYVNHLKTMSTHHYQLRAVVVHFGEVSSGHFVTYRRPPNSTSTTDNKWVYVSDEECHFSSFSEVVTSIAYMLFYEKI